MKEVDIRAEARAHIAKKYKTQKAAAHAWGITDTQLSRILNGNAVMPDSIASEIGYRLVQREAMWVKIKKAK